MTHTRMCQECPVSLEKLSFFFIQVKIIQVLVFDNWHPLKPKLCLIKVQRLYTRVRKENAESLAVS